MGVPRLAWRRVLSSSLAASLSLSALAALPRPANAASPQQPWEELGGSGSGGGISETPLPSWMASVDVDANGNPAVAWAEDYDEDAIYEIYVKKWTGSAWTAFLTSASGGGISGTAEEDSNFPQLKLDSKGYPVVAWSEGGVFLGYNAELYLLRWNGTSWEALDGSDTGEGVSSGDSGAFTQGRPALALDSNDNPVVAWAAGSATLPSSIRVKRWNGTDWVTYGGSPTGIISDGTGNSYPSLVLDPQGNPIVAWYNSTGFLVSQIYLKRWNGTAWVEVGGSASGLGVSAPTSFALNPLVARDLLGNPIVGWTAFGGAAGFAAFLKKWNGSTWIELGGSGSASGITGSSELTGLDVTPLGEPVVSWYATASSGNTEVFLRAWDGSAWSGLSGSSTGGGISGTSGPSARPVLSRGRSATLVVAWEEYISSPPVNTDVYVRRWNGLSLPELAQLRPDGITPIPVGGSVPGDDLILAGQISPNTGGLSVRLQVELRPTGTLFTGIPTAESEFASSATFVTLPFSGLSNGAYHWRARTMNSLGLTSPWVSYGSNPESNPDFTIQGGSDPGAPGPSDSGGDSEGGGGLCSGSAGAGPQFWSALLMALFAIGSALRLRRVS